MTRYLSFCIILFQLISMGSVAAVIQVTANADSGPGTLRKAVADASAGDEITFASSLSGDSIVLTSGLIAISKNLTITGPGADKLAFSGNDSSRIFRVDSNVTLTLTGLTLRNGKVTGTTDAGKGGCIFNKGIIHLTACVIRNNRSGYNGGGLYNQGSLYFNRCALLFNTADSSGGAIANVKGYVEMLNSTISANHAKVRGGGIYNLSLGSIPVPEVRLSFCTVTQNLADGEGGGIANTFDMYTDTSRVILGSSIVAENQAGNYGVDMFRDLSSRCIISSVGFNLIGNSDSSGILAVTGDIMGNTNSEINPNLRPLKINNTVLPYHPFDCGSPCLDSGDPFSSLTTDQLGQTRPFFGVNDIGAFESQVGLYIPLVYLGKDIDTCTLSSLSFDASSTGDSVNWFVNSLLKKANSQTFTYTTGKLDSVVVEVVSPAGCTGYDTLIVSLFDKIKPGFSNCPSNKTVAGLSGSCRGIATWQPPSASDNCHIDTVISNYSPGDTFPSGDTYVIYKAWDVAGNMDSCFFKVTVKDTVKPVIACGANITTSLDSGLCGAYVSYHYPSFSDNCTGVVLSMISGVDSGQFFNAGHTYVLYQVKDANNNTDTCGFNVFVKDTINPGISNPGDTIVSTTSGQCGAIVNFPVPAGTDNCQGAVTVKTAGLDPGSLFPKGKTKQSYKVTDAQGNSDSITFYITVEDREKPKIICPQDIQTCEQVVTYNDPPVSDNCPGVAMNRIEGPASGSTFNFGSTKITYVATDSAGNSDTCTFHVLVNHKPVISLINDTTIYYGDIFVLNAQVQYADNYEWSPATGLSDAFVKNPEAQPEADIDYVLKATSADGCEAWDTIHVKVLFEFIIPSAFTPDGDHVNDRWEIKGLIKYPDAELWIYDRWGRELFHSTGYKEKWDGTYNGNDLPIDSYYYILNLNDGSEIRKGTVTIIR